MYSYNKYVYSSTMTNLIKIYRFLGPRYILMYLIIMCPRKKWIFVQFHMKYDKPKLILGTQMTSQHTFICVYLQWFHWSLVTRVTIDVYRSLLYKSSHQIYLLNFSTLYELVFPNGALKKKNYIQLAEKGSVE